MGAEAILETERLTIREFDERDLPTFFVLGSDPEIIRYTGDPGGGFRNLDDAREVLYTRTLADYRRHGYGRWACVDKTTGEVIGFAGLKYLPDRDEVDLGYRFLPSHWGAGLATEAGRAVVADGFERLGLHRIIGLVLPENTASVRVLEKLGFLYEETIDDSGLEVKQYALEGVS
jgi:ribosomal-protein-alanine N-acetyltransferase